jgi:glycosyltransferase involved in cell wall biosynthesis
MVQQTDRPIGWLPARDNRSRVFVSELELSAPRPIEPGVTGFARASILVRLHGEPLGVVEVALEQGRLAADDAVERAWAVLFDRIERHCRRDGIAVSIDAARLPPAADSCVGARLEVRERGPMVSVVIPTRDRVEMLLGCVATLLAQDYPRFEIVVVDNAPRTASAADALHLQHGEDTRIRYVREERPGISFARNRGVATARGEIIAFTDDDVRVDPGWLTSLVGAFLDDPRVACATGLVMPAELDTPAQRWTEEFGGFNKGYEPRAWDLEGGDGALFPYAAGQFGSGQNMAFEARFLRRVNGFNTALGIGSPAMGGEDLAAFFQVMISGRRLAYVPNALVWHIHRRDLWSLRRQLFTYGVGLSAYLTSCVAERPQRLLEFLPRVPAGMRHLLSSRSAKNVRKSETYPRHLTFLELAGVLYGPVAYARGLWRARLLRRTPAEKARSRQ